MNEKAKRYAIFAIGLFINSLAVRLIDTSKTILVRPKSRCQVVDTARTKDSPGSMATLAAISRYTPKPRIRQPRRRKPSFQR